MAKDTTYTNDQMSQDLTETKEIMDDNIITKIHKEENLSKHSETQIEHTLNPHNSQQINVNVDKIEIEQVGKKTSLNAPATVTGRGNLNIGTEIDQSQHTHIEKLEAIGIQTNVNAPVNVTGGGSVYIGPTYNIYVQSNDKIEAHKLINQQHYDEPDGVTLDENIDEDALKEVDIMDFHIKSEEIDEFLATLPKNVEFNPMDIKNLTVELLKSTYCVLASSGNYRQTRTMSGGPTAAAEMVKRLTGGCLDPVQMDLMARNAVRRDGCRYSPGNTLEEALDQFGFEGYGFEDAINNEIGNDSWVTWVHGGRDDHCAVEAVERSGKADPAMLVVVRRDGGQQFIVTIGRDEKGDNGLFIHPSDGREVAVSMEDVRRGIYDQNTFFKQNGFLSK